MIKETKLMLADANYTPSVNQSQKETLTQEVQTTEDQIDNQEQLLH